MFAQHRSTSGTGSRLLLLLVMSNLLLCQGNFCTFLCPHVDDLCLNSLKDLFTRATNLSHYIYNLSSKMFNEFVSTYYINITNSCHTTSLHAPEEKEQVEHRHVSLIRWILMLLYSWNESLYHLVMNLRSMKEVSDAILSRARENVKKVKELQTFIERVFSQVSILGRWPEPTLSDRHHSAFFNLFHCLHRNSRKIDIYTKLLACQLLHDKC
uniref:Uncharacterized protein n=1 Tax=Bos mutus grunniens TaxID=30521 RepID=A0A8B9YW74_BOSMU